MAVMHPIEDKVPPKIQTTFYKPKDSYGCPNRRGFFVHAVSKNDEIPFDSKKIYIKALDILGDNWYPMAPSIFRIKYKDKTVEYDLRINLLNEKGHRIKIWDIYMINMCYGDPEYPRWSRGSGTVDQYYTVPIPEGYSGVIEVEFEDFSGNKAQRVFEVLEE